MSGDIVERDISALTLHAIIEAQQEGSIQNRLAQISLKHILRRRGVVRRSGKNGRCCKTAVLLKGVIRTTQEDEHLRAKMELILLQTTGNIARQLGMVYLALN